MRAQLSERRQKALKALLAAPVSSFIDQIALYRDWKLGGVQPPRKLGKSSRKKQRH